MKPDIAKNRGKKHQRQASTEDEDRLLKAIDGKRTVAEVLQVGGKGGDERRALGFFERLWQYDQVVFDATRAT